MAIKLHRLAEPGGQVIDITRSEAGAVDMKGGQQPSSGTQCPGELAAGLGPLAGGEVDDRVQRDDPRPGAIGSRQVQHRPDRERQHGCMPAGNTDHSRRDVDADDMHIPGGQEAGHMPGAAAHVGDRACPGQLGKGRQQATVQRLTRQLIPELVMVGTGDRVVGRLDANCHIRLTRDRTWQVRSGHKTTVTTAACGNLRPAAKTHPRGYASGCPWEVSRVPGKHTLGGCGPCAGLAMLARAWRALDGWVSTVSGRMAQGVFAQAGTVRVNLTGTSSVGWWKGAEMVQGSDRPGFGSIPYPGGVTFRVWAPNATAVTVYRPAAQNEPESLLGELAAEGNGCWSADVSGLQPDDEYRYRITGPPGQLSRLDACARQVTNSVGNVIIYDPERFVWTDTGYQSPGWDELVIYELHVGTFNELPGDTVGTLADAAEKLPYLARLGVSAVELLPLAEFATDTSWGTTPECRMRSSRRMRALPVPTR